jgi:hypothetical protein
MTINHATYLPVVKDSILVNREKLIPLKNSYRHMKNKIFIYLLAGIMCFACVEGDEPLVEDPKVEDPVQEKPDEQEVDEEEPEEQEEENEEEQPEEEQEEQNEENAEFPDTVAEHNTLIAAGQSPIVMAYVDLIHSPAVNEHWFMIYSSNQRSMVALKVNGEIPKESGKYKISGAISATGGYGMVIKFIDEETKGSREYDSYTRDNREDDYLYVNVLEDRITFHFNNTLLTHYNNKSDTERFSATISVPKDIEPRAGWTPVLIPLVD